MAMHFHQPNYGRAEEITSPSPAPLLSTSIPTLARSPQLHHIRAVTNRALCFEFVSGRRRRRRRGEETGTVWGTSGDNSSAAAPRWDHRVWLPEKRGSGGPSLSDVIWPSAGAFAAMAIMGRVDQILTPKGLVSMTIAPFGAVCAVLFATPSSPAARKYNMFMSQTGCAAMGVLAFSLFGPGWLARSSALAASIAFMIYTGATHPPAAALPLVFIDAAKFHHLNYWYILFPGVAGCILLSLIQEMVSFLKDNFKF